MTFETIWTFPILIIDNYPVTFGNLVIAIFVSFGILLISNLIRSKVGNYLSKRTQLSIDLIIFIDKVLLVLNLLLAIILTFKILHIPITELAVLGSAVAIGIGFAIKDTLNNIASGFVLLLEQAIKVGDVIAIDNIYGTVKAVRFRTLTIHTLENTDVIIPNGRVLDSEVTNWTMDDRYLLTNIAIQVAYDSDIQYVTHIMLNAIKKLPSLSPQREPFVLLSKFGEYCLIFKVYFAIEIQNRLERLENESQARYLLFNALHTANINIAIPQQNIHLDNQM